jgi:hypothetical protein
MLAHHVNNRVTKNTSTAHIPTSFLSNTRILVNTTRVSSIHNMMQTSLQTLPIEIIYRILDHLSDNELFMSISNVCQRLNMIIDSYNRYQVNLMC